MSILLCSKRYVILLENHKNLIGEYFDTRKAMSALAEQQEEIPKTQKWSKIWNKLSNISGLYRKRLQDIKVKDIYDEIDCARALLRTHR